MTSDKTPKQTENNNEVENIRLAYASSIQLMIYEGQLSWSTTSVFVTFAALLIAGAVFPSFISSTNSKAIAITGFLFAVAGLTSSLMWWSMVARSRRYYQYWVLNARELEKKMSRVVETLQRGDVFSKGNEVIVDGHSIRFKAIERMRISSNFYLFYGIFTVIFLSLLFVNIYRIILAF